MKHQKPDIAFIAVVLALLANCAHVEPEQSTSQSNAQSQATLRVHLVDPKTLESNDPRKASLNRLFSELEGRNIQEIATSASADGPVNMKTFEMTPEQYQMLSAFKHTAESKPKPPRYVAAQWATGAAIRIIKENETLEGVNEQIKSSLAKSANAASTDQKARAISALGQENALVFDQNDISAQNLIAKHFYELMTETAPNDEAVDQKYAAQIELVYRLPIPASAPDPNPENPDPNFYDAFGCSVKPDDFVTVHGDGMATGYFRTATHCVYDEVVLNGLQSDKWTDFMFVNGKRVQYVQNPLLTTYNYSLQGPSTTGLADMTKWSPVRFRVGAALQPAENGNCTQNQINTYPKSHMYGFPGLFGGEWNNTYVPVEETAFRIYAIVEQANPIYGNTYFAEYLYDGSRTNDNFPGFSGGQFIAEKTENNRTTRCSVGSISNGFYDQDNKLHAIIAMHPGDESKYWDIKTNLPFVYTVDLPLITNL